MKESNREKILGEAWSLHKSIVKRMSDAGITYKHVKKDLRKIIEDNG